MRDKHLSRATGGLAALALFALLLAWPLAAAAVADAGVRDFSYGELSAPTAQKPQSKLWFNDDVWWGSLFRTSTDNHEIFRFNPATNTWSPTGTVIDNRDNVKVDALWDGTRLYVVSAGSHAGISGDSARLYRFSYDTTSGAYTRDLGYPVTLVTGGMEAAVLDKDTTGKLWITYTRSSQVYVSHTTIDDRTWTPPTGLPVAGADTLTSDDISGLVSYDSKIGVMWSNQTEQVLYFATHADGAPDNEWSVTHALEGSEWIDDHINLKSLDGDAAGRVFVATKTSRDPRTDPEILLLVLNPDRTWSRHTFATVGDYFTRPIVLIDEENRELYVVAAAGPCCNGGTVYYKKTDLDNPSFEPGLGTPLIASASDTAINNATSTKQNLNGATGLLVEAGDDASNFYLHNFLSLGSVDTTPPDTSIDSGPEGVVTSTSGIFTFSSTEPGPTFECSLDGGVFDACASPQTYDDLASGAHTFQVRAADGAGNTDPTPASRTWSIATNPALLFGDGFEGGGYSAWTSVVTAGDGQAVVQGDVVMSGSYAAHLSATTNSNSSAYARKSLSAAHTALTVSGDFRILAQGSGTSGNVPLIRLYDPAGGRLISVFRQNGNAGRLYVGHSGANHLISGTLGVNVWAHLSVRVVAAGSGASTVEVRLNDSLVYQTTSASLGETGVLTLQIGNDTKQQPFTLIADNISAEL